MIEWIIRKILLSFFFMFVLFTSCQNKQENKDDIQIEKTSLDYTTGFILLDSMKNTDPMKIPRLKPAEYSKMQLNQVPELKEYDAGYLSKGKVLLDDEKGRLITITAITDGEITEFLLSYDPNGKLIDNIIVAYEDMVDYYNQKSYNISGGIITIQDVNFNYLDIDGNSYETSDTIYTSYKITPDLRFVKE